MIETKEKEIDGMTVMVTQFPASEGFKLFTKLMSVVSPVLGEAANVAKGGNVLDAKVDLESIGKALQSAVGSMNETEWLAFVKRMFADTRVDAKELKDGIDIVFAGKYMTMFKVLAFVIEVNYQDFWQALNEEGQTED